MNWTIAVPAYGKAKCDVFFGVTLPRIAVALAGFANYGRRVTWVVHTDRPDDVNKHIPGAITPLVIDNGEYETFAKAHREVWDQAPIGERVCFLCADTVPSREAFVYADRVLQEGAKAMLCAAPRTFAPEPPPMNADAEELLAWAMKYPHKIVSDTFYGTGGSENPTNIYFRKNDSIVMRGFHLHPFVAVKRAGADFKGTVDNDLLATYADHEIAVVKNREMALIEISPASRSQPCSHKPFRLEDFKHNMEFRGKPHHQRLPEHSIRIMGTEDCGDREAMAQCGIGTR